MDIIYLIFINLSYNISVRFYTILYFIPNDLAYNIKLRYSYQLPPDRFSTVIVSPFSICSINGDSASCIVFPSNLKIKSFLLRP